jgi:hypothetical protein
MDPAVECSTRLFGQMGCVPDFPSITTPILDFTMGQGYDVAGIAADVVASVALLDTAGVPVAKAAVANNLYSLPTASRPNVASLVALDASGNTLYSTPMPGAPR